MNRDKKPTLGALGMRAKQLYAEWLGDYVEIGGRPMGDEPVVRFILPILAMLRASHEELTQDVDNLAKAVRLMMELLVRSTGDENVEWFAAGGDVTRSGPHESQIAAWEAMRYEEYLAKHYRASHPENTRVWPERRR